MGEMVEHEVDQWELVECSWMVEMLVLWD